MRVAFDASQWLAYAVHVKQVFFFWVNEPCQELQVRGRWPVAQISNSPLPSPIHFAIPALNICYVWYRPHSWKYLIGSTGDVDLEGRVQIVRNVGDGTKISLKVFSTQRLCTNVTCLFVWYGMILTTTWKNLSMHTNFNIFTFWRLFQNTLRRFV